MRDELSTSIETLTAPLSWTVRYLTVCRSAGITHIRFQGAQDFGDETLNDLRQDFARVAEVLDRDSRVVLDFSDVVSFGAGAVNAVALFHKKLQTKGSRLALCALGPSVRASFFSPKDGTSEDAHAVSHTRPSEQNAPEATGVTGGRSGGQDRVVRGKRDGDEHERRR